jgi:hypothetical protein
VKLDGTDPCKLLSANALQHFGVDKEPRSAKDSTFQALVCDFSSNSTNTMLSLIPVTKVGIDQFAPGKVTGDVQNQMIQGFPAVQIHTPGASAGNDFCSVAVDVADGQVLHAMFAETGNKQPLTTDVVCQKANELADAAMTTLLAR